MDSLTDYPATLTLSPLRPHAVWEVVRALGGQLDSDITKLTRSDSRRPTTPEEWQDLLLAMVAKANILMEIAEWAVIGHLPLPSAASVDSLYRRLDQFERWRSDSYPVHLSTHGATTVEFMHADYRKYNEALAIQIASLRRVEGAQRRVAQQELDARRSAARSGVMANAGPNPSWGSGKM